MGGEIKTRRILGIDPGSRFTGYGCIDSIGREIRHVGHGVIRLIGLPEDDDASASQRLKTLFEDLSALMTGFRPQIVVVEKAFFAKNAQSALKLGQARGVALLCAALGKADVAEYSATEVKQALSGYGRADKTQVQAVVQMLLGRQHFLGPTQKLDATDALALALCHAQRGGHRLTTRQPIERVGL